MIKLNGFILNKEMSLTEQIYRLCAVQDSRTWNLAEKLVSLIKRNNPSMLVVLDNDLTIGDSLRIIVLKRSPMQMKRRIFLSTGLKMINIGSDTVYLPDVRESPDAGFIMAFRAIGDIAAQQYADMYECNLLQINETTGTGVILNQRAKVHSAIRERELIEYLHHPSRLAKWIEAGNEPEDYLA